METTIPLHSVVLTMQSPASAAIFPDHEILSLDAIKQNLVGNGLRPELSSIVWNEMRHQIGLKLSLGERVVVVGPLSHDQRVAIAQMAQHQGASVLYLLEEHLLTDGNLRHGDGIANVVVRDRQTLRVAKPMAPDVLSGLRQNFRGLTVVGDVHGNLSGLRAVSEWASSRRHFLWLLGDIVDYGHDTLGAMSMVYDLVVGGRAATILGNHERKIARWLHHQDTGRHPVSISEGNRVTIDALTSLSTEQRSRWIGQFRSVLSYASLIVHVGDITFAHAALHPDVWCPEDQANSRDVEQYALYGEPDKKTGSPHFRLSYEWIDAIPNGRVVFVGHEMRAPIPLAVRGAGGGRAVFLDTGSGKGGALSSADLLITDNNRLILENFNRHD